MKKNERKSCYNLQKFTRCGLLAVCVSWNIDGTLPRLDVSRNLVVGSVSTFSAQICAQTANHLEFWVVDLPAHKQRHNDRFMNEWKVLRHVLLRLRGTDATGRWWTNAGVLRWDALGERPDLAEKEGEDWKNDFPAALLSLWIICGFLRDQNSFFSQ